MADKKGGLGRGIGALIPTSSSATERPNLDVFFAPVNTLVSRQTPPLVRIRLRFRANLALFRCLALVLRTSNWRKSFQTA
jgi:hypothetical protein